MKLTSFPNLCARGRRTTLAANPLPALPEMPTRFVRLMFSRSFSTEVFGSTPNSLLKYPFPHRGRGVSIGFTIAQNTCSAGTASAGNRASTPRPRSLGRLADGIYQHAAPAALSGIWCSQSVFQQAVRHIYDGFRFFPIDIISILTLRCVRS